MKLVRKVRPIPVFTCQNCGSQFIPKDKKRWHASPSSPRYPKYCGPTCTATAKEKSVTVYCTLDGKPLYRNQAYASQSKHYFCNQMEYGIWQRGRSKVYREVTSDFKTWRKNRKIALARDNYMCVDCGIKDKKYWGDPNGTRIEVHHQIPRGTDEIDDHRLLNLVSLCKTDHKNRGRILDQAFVFIGQGHLDQARQLLEQVNIPTEKIKYLLERSETQSTL